MNHHAFPVHPVSLLMHSYLELQPAPLMRPLFFMQFPKAVPLTLYFLSNWSEGNIWKDLIRALSSWFKKWQ